MGRHSVIPQIEKKHKKSIEAILQDQVNQGKKPQEIALTLGIKKSLAYELLRHYDLRPKAITPDNQGRLELVQSYSGDPQSYLPTVIQDFLISKEIGGKTRNTIKSYGDNLGRFSRWIIQEGIPPEIPPCFTTEIIRRFLYYVQTADIRFGGNTPVSRRKVSRSTIDTYYRILCVFGTWLIAEGKLEINPMDRIGRPGQDKKIVPEIPMYVIQDIIDNKCNGNFEGIRDRAMVLILTDTGIRLSELTGMDRDLINFDTGLIKIFGKGRKERIVRISEKTKNAVLKYLESRDLVKKDGSFWIRANGEDMDQGKIRWVFYGFREYYPGIPLNPHSFRHTWALNFYRVTRDMLSLKDLGGWSDLSMPEHYAAAITHEDAIEAHVKGSPVDNFLKLDKEPEPVLTK